MAPFFQVQMQLSTQLAVHILATTQTGKTKLERPSTLEAYDSLTEEKVLGWVKAKINAESPAVRDEETGKTAVQRWEDIMDRKMSALNVPETATGKPF